MIARALLIATLQAVATVAAAARPPLAVAEIGHFYVGGRTVTIAGVPPRARFRSAGLPPAQIDPNGTFTTGATYVGFVRLAHPRHRYPIVLLPGGGFSGAVYETTPDGRPGWLRDFLDAGHSTYVVDLDRTGRSARARYPEVDPDEPAFRSNAFLWEVLRIGAPGSYAADGGPRAYPGTRFPVASFTAFANGAQPRYPITAEAEAPVYDAVVRAACPCILLAHSASGGGALAAALRWPDQVKAVIAVEPASVPAAPPQPGGPPHLFVWGDYLTPDVTSKDWSEELAAAEAYRAALDRAGTRADLLALPQVGIRGNSHMLMADDNSRAIAALIERWLSRRGL
jgi:pimeloyl-ACP methyl ester carboxylesterase